ncbi:MAG TPA: transposase family protein [Steroidobacteraceae bacterium]|nr:transposase family protein [Steroidobacteraceae bacterium]
MEIDLVAHCGEVLKGAFVHTLTMTDIASGWTECVPLVVRDSALVIEAIDHLQPALPFAVRGLDIDNGGEFLNEALVAYCKDRAIELTRSRPYGLDPPVRICAQAGQVQRRQVLRIGKRRT